ncbi:hypothetical protein TSAR_001142, partial [Trichomalopsis sarcophagae]
LSRRESRPRPCLVRRTHKQTETRTPAADQRHSGAAEQEERERVRSLWRDADNMRVSVFVSVALVAVLLAEGTSSGSCEHFAKPRTKPREIRGFQPEYISTAYGFGKREIAKQDKYEKIMLLLLQNSPQSIPASWILHEMRQNPELAKRIVRKIVDGAEEDNPGKLSTAELFKSERKISFF